MSDFARLLYMALWRSLTSSLRYRLNFVFTLISAVAVSLAMVALGLAFDQSLFQAAVGTRNVVAFLVLGISYQSWQNTATYSAAAMFQEELITGQIEYTFVSPVSRYSYIMSNICASAAYQSVFFVPLFVVGAGLAASTLSVPGVALGLCATLLSVLALAQIGSVFAALALRYKQIGSFFTLFTLVFQFLTGMFVPLRLFPGTVQLLSASVVPVTCGMDLLRHYVINTRTLFPEVYEWLILVAQCVLYGVVARVLVRRLEESSKEAGLHYL